VLGGGGPARAARALAALVAAGVPVAHAAQGAPGRPLRVVVGAAAADDARLALASALAAPGPSGLSGAPAAPAGPAADAPDGVAVRAGVATLTVVGPGLARSPLVTARLLEALAESSIPVVAVAQHFGEPAATLVVEEADAARAQQTIHAAFRLDKLGGGGPAAARHGTPDAPADVVLLGFGLVGRAVARQLASATAAGPAGGTARVVAVVDRSGYVFAPGGLSAPRLAALARAKRDGAQLATAAGGVAAPADAALAAIARHALSRPVLVDVTAGDTGAVLETAVRHGMDLVLANKRPLADQRAAADGLARAAAAGGRRVLHEATVGAGLPLLDTLRKLEETGDRVLKVAGCPSGTLGFLFGELGRGVPFSEALRQAMAAGYTEPDPRDDLSGADVARKAIILGRLLGWRGEPGDVRPASLVPPALAGLTRDAFVARVLEDRVLDAPWARRVAEARARGLVLRYRASATRRQVRVGLAAVSAADALAGLTGTDNQFSITTLRYRTRPLVITGPGAGAEVTAAGVVNDVLKLAATR
jgi:aspartokinase/homoserine dehydrogenase 1